MVKTMSDPVTNVEIEDVLSSIRRLVSSDERPKSVTPVQATPASADPERLVLTPSLRVDGAASDPSENAPTVELDVEESAGGANRSWPESAAQDGASGGDMAASATPEQAAVPAESAEMDKAATAQPLRDPKAELKARVAELEEVVSRQGDQWDPDGASPDANSGSPVASLPWEDYATDAAEEMPQPASVETDDPAARAQHRDPAIQPDVASDDTGEGSDGFAAESILDADAPLADAPLGDSARDFLAASDEFLDEDALRDLVADIVRQELQGALGERITRNVRKLVRREIHRALTNQELQ